MPGFEEIVAESVLLAAKTARDALTRPEGVVRSRKQDHSVVTAADLACQTILLTAVAQVLPSERVLAEESAGPLKDSVFSGQVRELVEDAFHRPVAEGEILDAIEYRGNPNANTVWFVDPIDGTRGYLEGLHYAVAIARVVDGAPEHSWLAVPMVSDGALSEATGKLFKAVRGEGATYRSIEEGEWQTLPNRHTPPDDRLAIVASRAHDTVHLPRTVNQKKWGVELLSMDSQAKYAALAIGRADLYPRKPSRWFGHFFCWDHAAGALLVSETGGVVTDLAGKAMDWTRGERLNDNRGIFAASSVERYEEFQPQFAAAAHLVD